MKYLLILLSVISISYGMEHDDYINFVKGFFKGINPQGDFDQILHSIQQASNSWDLLVNDHINSRPMPGPPPILLTTGAFVEPALSVLEQIMPCSENSMKEIQDSIKYWIIRPNEFFGRVNKCC